MFTNTQRLAFATLLATGLTVGMAHAQAPDTSGRVPSGGAVLGGGLAAAIVGGDDDMVVLYGAPGAGGGGAGWSQAGRIARFVATDGDGPRIEYAVPAAPPQRWARGVAGRRRRRRGGLRPPAVMASVGGGRYAV
jgi:hypothetical protein